MNTMHCNTLLCITSSSDYKMLFHSQQGMNRPDFENILGFLIFLSYGIEYLLLQSIFLLLLRIQTE